MRNLILGGVLREIFKVQECFVSQKSIFDLFGQKWRARMVTVNCSGKRIVHSEGNGRGYGHYYIPIAKNGIVLQQPIKNDVKVETLDHL